MPQFVVAGIAYLGAAVGGLAGATLIMYSTQIAVGAMLLGSMALSSSAKRKAERKARAQYNASQVDRMANVPSTTAPRELVLGRVRKGGHVFFRGSVGANKEKFVMLIAIAGHEIDGVEQIWLNDVAVTLDAGGWVQTAPYALTRTVTGSVAGSVAPPEAIPGSEYTTTDNGEFTVPAYTTYQYLVTTSKARITVYTGTPGQAADAGVVSDFPGLWSSDHRADGIAYLKCEFFYDETAFPSGLPTVTATVRGARCLDPRSGLTAFTENPALHQRHVLTHPYFGKRSALSADEDARIIAAANACDVGHDYGAGSVPLYRASIVLPFGTAARDGLDDLAQAMAGQWAYAGGEFFVRAGVYGAPVLALTEADLATVTRDAEGSQGQQAISISTHRPRADQFNSVAPRIWDAAQDYKQVALAPVKGAALIAADGAELVQEVDMPGVFFAEQAQHVAGVLMRDARDPLTVTAAFKLRAYPLTLFDTITLTLPRYGWAAKEFMVLGRQWTLGGMVQLQLKETAAAIFQPDAAFVASGYADNTALPKPWEIDPPASLSAASGTAELVKQADGTILTRVRVSWSPIADAGVRDAGSVEVQWAPVATDLAWSSVVTSGQDTQAVISGVPDGRSIFIRARTRTTLAVSDWSEQLVHFVVGKTEPPPAFDFFQVLAQPDGTRQFNFKYTITERPVDWLGAEIRYTAGSVPSPVWEAMQPLQDTATHYTASPVETNAPIEGEWTFAVRSKDTTGNLSAANVITIDLGPRRSGNTFAEVLNDPAWPGTKSNFVLFGGVLEALSSATWTTAPATWDAWTLWSSSPAASASYTTPGLDLGSAVAGQVDATVDAAGTTTIEVSTSADGSSWGSWFPVANTFTARWVRLRVTVAATGPEPVAVLRRLDWRVSAEIKSEYLNDLVISALTGAYRIGTGDVRAPLAKSYALLRTASAIVQDTGTWTVTRIDKNTATGPRFQFRNAGTLADPALVDFYIEGL